MKGYLQRLVLGVKQPVGSIHPLVGSVFSPPQHTAAHEPLGATEGFFSSRLHSSHEQDTHETSSTPRQKLSVATAPGEAQKSGDPAPAYTPLMPEVPTPKTASQATQITDGKPQPLSPVPEEGKGVSLTLPDHAMAGRGREANAAPEGQAQELMLTHLYAPMMNANPSASRELAALRTNPFTGAARGRGEGNASRSSAPVAREADEIQIHIGRIEVTAVQQRSAPPAAKPTRKGMSLDEYLRHSDGRV